MKSYSKNSCIVINSGEQPDVIRDKLKLCAGTIYCIDAIYLAMKIKCKVNMIMLGALAKASGFAILGQNGIYDAYNDCSQLATIGAALLTILGFFLTIVSGALGIIYFILVAAAIFSLTLMVGGIWCYLNTLHHHNNNCCYRNNM